MWTQFILTILLLLELVQNLEKFGVILLIFVFFTLFYCKILYDLLSFFLPNVYCFLICFYKHVGDFSLENHIYIILIVDRVVWMSPVLGRLSVSWHLICVLEK
jgi:hypothetical protein